MKAETAEDEVGVSLVLRERKGLSEVDFITFCTAQMPYYMVPRFVHLTSELPVNASQKVEKEKLRRLATEEPELFWDREKAGIRVHRRAE